MGKIDSWVTKLPRLKNSKVARFSYRAEAYANDDIEGVENYDYSRDMNIPLATHTDFDPDMLSVGARTNFSSIPKNGLNHFFGRVSYNLNKVIDFLADFLTDFISLEERFTSFTEIVSFSSSATLSNYADGTTKRLLNTSGSDITITLPAGETYLGSNTITLEPSIMLTITKRGTVWINSSGNAITAITADKWKTARNITISDADGTNTGTAVSVDGSENETLKLPSTIKANLTGNADTATKLATPKFTGKIKTEKAMNNVVFYDENDEVVNPVNAIAGLEIGDVVWIKYEGYDKLHTVELLEAGYMIVNYEHCDTRGKGSLMLEDKTNVSATVELLTKWFNAPIGLGQAWVGITGSRAAGVSYTNTTNRSIQVSIYASNFSNSTGFYVDQTEACYSGSGRNYGHLFQGQAIVPSGSTYKLTGDTSSLKWRELR